jgi:chromosome segregation ATPase
MIGASVPPADVQSVYSLIALITDPKAAKGWLDQIAKANSDAAEKLAEATAKSAEATAKLTEAKDAQADADAKLVAARNIQHSADAQAKDLSSKTNEFLERKSAIELDLETRQKSLAEANRALIAREVAITEREDSAHRITETAQAKIREYDAKLADLKRITG